MPTPTQLRDTLRELVCDELKARGPLPALVSPSLPVSHSQLHNIWAHNSRCHTASWPATVTSLLTQPSGKTASG
jgi:hypothetical protein